MPKTIYRPDNAVLCRLLREIREAAGVTQTDLSAGMGRSQSFISDIERGLRRLDLIELRDLCRLLDVELRDFVDSFEKALTELPATRAGKKAPRKRR